ncbi:type II secretion system protein G [Anaerohalosphaera lusitana]|uniref:Type II secretion system protein G n=1 Tax=Anaerohalosphaera lusitana TaxID=1936003 RepID=A0A1U9NGE2_9BACT|nr:type II secretion system protein [Anaerohalosphaera lusitana]AQT67002.1 type II secretion system protein G [Anaerohalosphaera lusitana]
MARSVRAFTLIELLVVISIMGLILAIMLPALAEVKDKAYQTVCSSNLKQYGIAVNAYAAGNGGELPRPDNWLYSEKAVEEYFALRGSNACRWHDAEIEPDGLLWPYLKAEKVHVCPSFERFAKSEGSGHAGHDASVPIDVRYSYAMNGYLGTRSVWWRNDPTPGSVKDNPTCGVVRLSALKRPGSTILFTEETLEPIDGVSRYGINDNVMLARWYPLGREDYCDAASGYHSMKNGDPATGRANTVFADGSASNLDVSEAFEFAYPFSVTRDMRR